MNISTDSLMDLDYNPAKDILTVSLPDIRENTLREVARSLQGVVDAVRNYDIKRMLLDSSRTVIEVGDEEYHKVVKSFSQGLANTRLRALARVGSSSVKQEVRASIVTNEVKVMLMQPVLFQNFYSKADALSWLESC